MSIRIKIRIAASIQKKAIKNEGVCAFILVIFNKKKVVILFQSAFKFTRNFYKFFSFSKDDFWRFNTIPNISKHLHVVRKIIKIENALK